MSVFETHFARERGLELDRVFPKGTSFHIDFLWGRHAETGAVGEPFNIVAQFDKALTAEQAIEELGTAYEEECRDRNELPRLCYTLEIIQVRASGAVAFIFGT